MSYHFRREGNQLHLHHHNTIPKHMLLFIIRLIMFITEYGKDPKIQHIIKTGLEYHQILRTTKAIDPIVCISSSISNFGAWMAFFSYGSSILVRLPFWIPGAMLSWPMNRLISNCIKKDPYRETHSQWKLFGIMGYPPIMFLLTIVTTCLVGPDDSKILYLIGLWIALILVFASANYAHNDLIFAKTMMMGIWQWKKIPKVCKFSFQLFFSSWFFFLISLKQS